MLPIERSTPRAEPSTCADGPSPEVEARCRALRLSNVVTATSWWMIQSEKFLRDADAVSLADLKLLMAGPDWSGLLQFLRADWIARARGLDGLDLIVRRAECIPPHEVAPPPLLTGDDLKAML